MYILQCVDDSYYVGSTKNLELRLAQHQEGKGARYTARRLPVKLVYSEEYERVADAFNREKQVQNWSRAKREALIKGTPELLPALAKKKFEKQKVQEDTESMPSAGGLDTPPWSRYGRENHSPYSTSGGYSTTE